MVIQIKGIYEGDHTYSDLAAAIKYDCNKLSIYMKKEEFERAVRSGEGTSFHKMLYNFLQNAASLELDIGSSIELTSRKF